MNIPNIRLLNQQLLNPLFREPKELVSWMGAMQAQNYSMVKWAVGMRLKSATIQTVEKALREGEILRTHVMRPTWHLVAAEDIRWMLKLSAQRIISANDSFAKGYDSLNQCFENFLNRNFDKRRGVVRINRLQTCGEIG